MKDLQDQIANELGITRDQVVRTIELFAVATHRSFYELDQNVIGKLWSNTSSIAFFHPLGVRRAFAEMVDGEFDPEEYLLRMGTREHWKPFSDQMKGWKQPEGR